MMKKLILLSALVTSCSQWSPAQCDSSLPNESAKFKISTQGDELVVVLTEDRQKSPNQTGRIRQLFNAMTRITSSHPGLGLVKKTSAGLDQAFVLECTDVPMVTTCSFLIRKHEGVQFSENNGLISGEIRAETQDFERDFKYSNSNEFEYSFDDLNHSPHSHVQLQVDAHRLHWNASQSLQQDR